jgi:hypothetical protein
VDLDLHVGTPGEGKPGLQRPGQRGEQNGDRAAGTERHDEGRADGAEFAGTRWRAGHGDASREFTLATQPIVKRLQIRHVSVNDRKANIHAVPSALMCLDCSAQLSIARGLTTGQMTGP